eukprot:tig00000073_g1695.t1
MRVSCRGYNFSSVSADDILAHVEEDIGPEDVEALNLSNNELSSCAGLFAFSRLSILDLSHNSLGQLSELARTITHLNVAYNKIERLHLELLPNLQVLDASFNLISDMRGLSRNRNLKDVRMSGNRISVIEGLEAAKQLETLDVRHNLLSKLEDLRALSFNVRLHNLELRGNPVVSVVPVRELRITIMHLVPALMYMDGEKPPRSPRSKSAVPTQGQRMKLGSYHHAATPAEARRSLVRPFAKVTTDRVVDGEEEAEEGAGGLPKLIRMLGHPRQDKVERALYVLRNSCLHSHANKETIRDAGGFPALLALLAPERSSLTLELAAGVLWHCSTSGENRRELVEMGAVRLLTELLGGEELPTRVVEAALGLLMALCEEAPAQEEARAAGALPTVVRLLDAPSALCQERAVAALANLCEGNEANCRGVAISGAVQRLAGFLAGGSSDTLLRSTCLCLRAMSAQRIVLDPHLVLDPLVSLLEHPAPAVQDAAAAALTAYTENCPSRRSAPLIRRQLSLSSATSPRAGPLSPASLGPASAGRAGAGRQAPSSPTTSSYASRMLRAASARYSWADTLRGPDASPSLPSERATPRGTPARPAPTPASGRSTPLRASASAGSLRVHAWTTDASGRRVELPGRSREIAKAMARAASPASTGTPRSARRDFPNSYHAWMHSLRGEGGAASGDERAGAFAIASASLPARPATPSSSVRGSGGGAPRGRPRSPSASASASASAVGAGAASPARTSYDFWAEALKGEYVRQHFTPRSKAGRSRGGGEDDEEEMGFRGAPAAPQTVARPLATPSRSLSTPARSAAAAAPAPRASPRAPPPPPPRPDGPAAGSGARPKGSTAASPKGKSPVAPRPAARTPTRPAPAHSNQGGWFSAASAPAGQPYAALGLSPSGSERVVQRPRVSPPVQPLQAPSAPAAAAATAAVSTPTLRKSILKPSPAPSPSPSPAAGWAGKQRDLPQRDQQRDFMGSPGTGRRSAHESPDVSFFEQTTPRSAAPAPAPAPAPVQAPEAERRAPSPSPADQLNDILKGLSGVLTAEEESILVRTIRETQNAIAASRRPAPAAAHAHAE